MRHRMPGGCRGLGGKRSRGRQRVRKRDVVRIDVDCEGGRSGQDIVLEEDLSGHSQ